MREEIVKVEAGPVVLDGFLNIPENATGIVVFVHGSGSSRHSPRNQYVAELMNKGGLATLLFDLLTPEEEGVDLVTREHRFNIALLAERVVGAADWLSKNELTRGMRIGYIGSSTGAAAALVAAAKKGGNVSAIVSRGGRPDLAGPALPLVKAPTLLIVGEYDTVVIELNAEAAEQMNAEKKIEIVPGATHLFEETGTLEKASHLALSWFLKYLS
jgi:dienelactone hydrolase